MTNDDFLNKVKATIKERIESDKRIKLYRQKVAQGTASIRETIKQNSHIANLIGTTISDYMPTAEAGQGLREYICREILRDQHRDTNAMMAQVQKAIDEKLGLQLKAKTAPFPEERVDTVAHSLEDPTVALDVIQRRARSATENVINSYADDFVQENAKLRNDAGLKCYLTRYTSGNCCKWCDSLAGKYEYESAPDDIFRRHDNCDCVVTYECGRTRQDVWSKKSWEAPETDKSAYKSQVLSREQAKAIEAQNMQYKGIDKASESGIIKTGSRIKISMQFFAKKSEDFATIILPKQEYAHVMSEIATNISEEHQRRKVFKKAIGDYMYTVENNGFGNYRIIGKDEIE